MQMQSVSQPLNKIEFTENENRLKGSREKRSLNALTTPRNFSFWGHAAGAYIMYIRVYTVRTLHAHHHLLSRGSISVYVFMYMDDNTTSNICGYGATHERRRERKMNKYDKKMYMCLLCLYNMLLKIKNKIKLLWTSGGTVIIAFSW